jgi:predicted ATPase
MIKRYIITGGPGAGKTSVLNILKTHGYHCIGERSRMLIDKALKENSDIVPWKNLGLFNEKVVEAQTKDYLDAKEGIHFFDRGLPDNVAYFWHFKQEMPRVVLEAAQKYKYEPLVFMTPPWKEIYKTDAARTEPFEDAVGISDMIKKSYKEFGYEIIELPKTTVKERAEFIKEKIK